MSESPDDIVGHKTFSDDGLSFRHEPLTRAEAEVLQAAWEAADKKRAELMPDERSAILMLNNAHTRLQELGWHEAHYCPKDGTAFEVIEAGSTGIHRCRYQGEWPNGSFWIEGDGDLWPSRPILFRLIPS